METVHARTTRWASDACEVPRWRPGLLRLLCCTLLPVMDSSLWPPTDATSAASVPSEASLSLLSALLGLEVAFSPFAAWLCSASLLLPLLLPLSSLSDAGGACCGAGCRVWGS